MSKNNAKSLTLLRQKHRKYTREFEEEIAQFRENPELEDSDGERDDFDKDDIELAQSPSAISFKKESSIIK